MMNKIRAVIIKANATLEVDLSSLPDHAYAEAMTLGLEQLLNRGMLKAKTHEDAMKIAKDNLKLIYENKFRITRTLNHPDRGLQRDHRR